MTIDTSGKVGVGTNAPSVGLELYDGSGNATIKATGTTFGTFMAVAGTATGLLQADPSGFVYLGTSSNHPIKLLTNNATRLTIDTSGRVGIGTAGPTNKLSIAGGDLRFDTNNTGIQFTNTSNAMTDNLP